MSYVQPRMGVFNATPFFFTQQPSQPFVISSLRLNESVQNIVTSQKSVPNSVTQTTETKAADKEVIVLSSDSESDTETRRPIVSRKTKGKEKEGVSCVNEGMKNKNSEASASIIVDQTPSPNSDVHRDSVVNDNDQHTDSLSNNATISNSTHENGVSTNKKNLLDGYALMSNKEQSSLFQLVNPVRIFLNILEDHKTNVGLFDIIVDFTRIYLEIYEEDKRIITKLHDLRTLVVDLLYCLMSKIKDDNYVAKSKRFKQVELLARKAIEEIEKLKESGLTIADIGEILKRIDDYRKGRRFQDERKRRNEEEGIPQEEKRRKQEYEYNKRFFEREEIKREFIRQREQRKREQQRLQEERILREALEKESVRKEWEELEKKMKSQENMANYINKIPPSKRLDHPSMPAPSQFVPYGIQPRKNANDEAELVGLLSEPLHDLITTQIVYNLYKNLTPFRMSETVGRCSVDRIFRLNFPERAEYCKQLYRQYVNTNMDGTAKVIESWIKTRVLGNANPYTHSRRW